jgi:hypothetical protein
MGNLYSKGAPSDLATAVRRNLTQLECEIEALSKYLLPVERAREVSRIEACIEDLRQQLGMIGG